VGRDASSIAACPPHHASHGPPPPLRSTARGRISNILLATRQRPSFANYHAIQRIVAAQKGGEAPKGACQPFAAQHQQTSPLVDVSQTSVRSLRHLSATRLRAISGRARLPALRPRLLQGFPSLLNSRPCFLGLGIKRALPALSCPSPVTAPHASAVVPKGMMPKAAPERVASPRGGTALAPLPKVPSRRRPSMSEIM
jgi:hypothetical protein